MYNVRHVAIIMDGNRRWAEQRGLYMLEGHKAGAENVRRIIRACRNFGIKYITLYTFSSENWNRPKTEINGLMLLLRRFIRKNIDELNEEGIRLRAIGRLEKLPANTRKILLEAIESTKDNNKGDVILALSYGSRGEILDAVRKICLDVNEGRLSAEGLDEEAFRKYLYAPDVPDPELLIRTSGEMRVSNFLLWQISYSEIWITDKYWPDFDESDLKQALEDYSKRDRRFGRRSGR